MEPDTFILSFDNLAFPYATNREKDISIGLSREIFQFLSCYQPEKVETISTKTILRNPIERMDFSFVLNLIEKTANIQVVPDKEMELSTKTGYRRATRVQRSDPPVLLIAQSCEEAVNRYIHQFHDASRIIDEATHTDRLREEITSYFTTWEDDLYRLGISPPPEAFSCKNIIEETPTILLNQDVGTTSPETIRTRMTSVIVIKPWRIQFLKGKAKDKLSFYKKNFPGVNIPLLCIAEKDLKTKPEPQKKNNRPVRCTLF